MDAIETINEFLIEKFGAGKYDITRLTGDASDRAYYRVAAGAGVFSGAETAVAMFMAASQVDLPFLSVGGLLDEAGAPVPRVEGIALERGIVLLEDLGDITLMEAVSGAGDADWRRFYYEAMDIMIGIQVGGAALQGKRECVCFGLAFDVEKLMFEFGFFIDNALRVWKGARLSPALEGELRKEFTNICEELSAEPRYLCHRDYHSRNLMYRAGKLRVIDFQDARMGPLQYDLASLLCDSYVDMPSGLAEELYSRYPARLEALGGPNVDKGHFDYVYDLMVIQRNIKAAGSFAYLDCVKKLDRYLSRMCECMGHVRAAFERRPEFARLREILSEYFEELR